METRIIWTPTPHRRALVLARQQTEKLFVDMSPRPQEVRCFENEEAPAVIEARDRTYRLVDGALWRPMACGNKPCTPDNVVEMTKTQIRSCHDYISIPWERGSETVFDNFFVAKSMLEGLANTEKLGDLMFDAGRDKIRSESDASKAATASNLREAQNHFSENIIIVDDVFHHRAPSPTLRLWSSDPDTLSSLPLCVAIERNLFSVGPPPTHSHYLEQLRQRLVTFPAFHGLSARFMIEELTNQKIVVNWESKIEILDRDLLDEALSEWNPLEDRLARLESVVKLTESVIGKCDDETVMAYVSLRRGLREGSVRETLMNGALPWEIEILARAEATNSRENRVVGKRGEYARLFLSRERCDARAEELSPPPSLDW